MNQFGPQLVLLTNPLASNNNFRLFAKSLLIEFVIPINILNTTEQKILLHRYNPKDRKKLAEEYTIEVKKEEIYKEDKNYKKYTIEVNYISLFKVGPTKM
jgi:phage-related protein